MTHRYSRLLPSFTLVSDILLLNIAYLLAHGNLSGDHPRYLVLKTLCWLLLSPLFWIYKTPRPLILKESLFRFLEVLGCHLALIFLVIYINNDFTLFSYPLFLTYVVFVLLVIAHRFLLSSVLNYIRKKGFNGRRIIIIGDTEVAERLHLHFKAKPAYGYEVLHDFLSPDISQYTHDELNEQLTDKGVHEIFFCYKKMAPELIGFLVSFGVAHGIKIKLVSDLILTDHRAKIINYDSLPVLHLKNEQNSDAIERIAKRTFDILFSSTLIVVGSPLLATLYVITRFSSKGPACYTQERIGLNGKAFKIIKFRSMYTDAELSGPQLSSHGDPRITKWGKIIRKTRLDELPQFINVLKGEMSVVGPRPERLHFIEQISAKAPHYRLLQNIKPGITSIGQIRYGYAENVEQMCERMEFDLLYIHNISLRSDLHLILKTVRVMVQGKGK